MSGSEAAEREVDREIDRELVRRYRAGDENAARELYDRHVGQMLAIVRLKLKSVRNRSTFDSEGIFQAGFRSFLSEVKKPKFDQEKWNIGGLLSRIVQRWCARVKRRKNHEIAHDPHDLRNVVDAALADSDSPDAAQATAECFERIVADLRQAMTPLQMDLLAAYLDPDDSRSISQLASDFGCSLSFAQDTIEDFEAALRELLEAEQDDEETGNRPR